MTRRIKMNSLPTNAQVQTWMGLARKQFVSAIVLLALLAAMAVALAGAAYYVREQAYGTDSSSLMAGIPRCPRGCI
jgi:hypothetical protein